MSMKLRRNWSTLIAALGLIGGLALVALAQTPTGQIGPTAGGSSYTGLGVPVIVAATSVTADALVGTSSVTSAAFLGSTAGTVGAPVVDVGGSGVNGLYGGTQQVNVAANGISIASFDANRGYLLFGTAYGFGYSDNAAAASGSADAVFVRHAAGVFRAAYAGSLLGAVLEGEYIISNTGTATPAITASGTYYTNTGDADGSQVTLPDNPTVGTTFTIVATAAFNITVVPNTGETLMFGNTVCGTSFVVGGVATGIGDSATVLASSNGNGAVWMVTASAGTPVCTP